MRTLVTKRVLVEEHMDKDGALTYVFVRLKNIAETKNLKMNPTAGNMVFGQLENDERTPLYILLGEMKTDELTLNEIMGSIMAEMER